MIACAIWKKSNHFANLFINIPTGNLYLISWIINHDGNEKRRDGIDLNTQNTPSYKRMIADVKKYTEINVIHELLK